ncbi:amidohydrolase family protein [Patulibacter defluvii]|uniref:amidohydrolase family protein n=1 Tax=Patulibacter defluvii TaxID=3095358 RepID=UPI002A74AE88|nr:amidohydrolase family protein [Patulibacter sp. DM4]
MPLRPAAEDLIALYRAAAAAVGEDLPWFDAHTHVGQNDPDGQTATAEEILAGLDAAGHRRALTFAMHEPDGYGAANDEVLRAAAASDGRLLALARVAPTVDGALDEARRCLDAGARGFKLHPRSDAFALTHPVVEQVVALAAERRLPVLFHAGRGIPQLGAAATALAERHPGARLILAHAGISDLGDLAPAAARLPNLFFDTSWWHPSDLLQLFATIPPGRILYASDMPYGPGMFSAFAFLRCAAAVGTPIEALREMAGGQLARVLAGDDPVELGPAPGVATLGARWIEGERVASYAAVALQLAFNGVDPGEPIALARYATQIAPEAPQAPLLGLVDRLLARAQERLAAGADGLDALGSVLAAGFLAATPGAGVPDVAL